MQDSFVRSRAFSDSSALRFSRNQVSASFISRQEGLVQFAQEQLGLTEIQAKLLVYGNSCDSKNEIYNLLVKDGPNHTYLHLFCPGVIGLCLICQESVDRHSVISSVLYKHLMERIEFSDRERSEEGSIQDHQPTVQCTVCFNHIRQSEIVAFNGTEHSICLDCYNNFLNEEINNGRVSDLKCPHCNIALKPQWIEQLVDQRTFKKYKLFLSNQQIFSNPQLRWCPNPKCSKIIELKSKSGRKASCVCGTVICIKCNRQEHPKLTCDQVFKNEIKEWADATDIQKCKKCKSVVQKISGCNHMTCGFCKYEWCWLCGSTFSPIHFSPFNPLGCPGLQNGDHTSSNWGCLRLWVYRLAWLFAIMILIPFVIPTGLVAAGPTLFISWSRNSSWYYYRGACFKFWLWILLIILGLMLNPIVWVGVLIYSIPMGIKYLIKYKRHRRQIEQTSAQHLRDRLIQQRLNQ